MKTELNYPYPTELFDNDGYPTDEALDYIKNWYFVAQPGGEGFLEGIFCKNHDYEPLIEYVKSLWCYGDNAYKQEDGLFELHTLGWSGNESIIYELKQTIFWMMKLRAKFAGGHYYFELDKDGDYEWDIVKVKKRS